MRIDRLFSDRDGNHLSRLLLAGFLAAGVIPSSTARAADPYPNPGEVIFTELMINPSTGNNAGNEWIELFSRANAPVKLDGCVFKEGIAGSCTINGVTSPGHCFTLPSTTPVSLAPAALQLMALNATEMTSLCTSSGTVIDYSNLSLNNTGEETLELYCPDNVDGTLLTLITAITYQWDKIGGAKGHSWMLDQAFFTTGDATSAANWCVAPDSDLTCTDSSTSTTFLDYGTPGSISNCPIPPTVRYPEPGSVYFNELDIFPSSSTSSPEYIELGVKSAPVIEGEPPVQLNGCMLRAMSCDTLTAEQCIVLPNPTFTTSQTLLEDETETYALTEGSLVLLAKGTTGTCLSYDPLDPGVCLVPSQVGYGTETLFNSNRRLLELSCPDSDGNQRTIDRVVYEKTLVDADCRQSSDRCSWELRLESSDATLNDDPGNWGAAPSSAEYTAGFTSSVPDQAYGTPGAINQVGPRIYLSPLTEGDVAFTELAIWPGTTTASPDWLEIEVLNSPALDAFDLGQCVLRTYDCTGLSQEGCLILQLSDSGWSDDSALTPVLQSSGKEDLLAVGGERWLFGASSTKTCLAIDENNQCIRTSQASFSSTVGLSNSEMRLFELACPDENQQLQTIDRLVYSKEWEDLTCGRDDLHCSWELRPPAYDPTSDSGGRIGQSSMSPSSTSPTAWAENDDPKNWGASTAPYITSMVNGEPDIANGTPGDPNSAPAMPITAGPPREGDVAISELMIDPVSGSPEWFELQGVQQGPGGGPLELAGCILLEASASSVVVDGQSTTVIEDCSPDNLGGCKSFQIPTQLVLPINADEQKLFVSGDHCLALDPSDETGATCAASADLLYDTLSFSTTTEQELTLWCPGTGSDWTNVDRFRFKWSDVSKQCNTEDESTLAACSLMVQEEHINATDNDDAYYRCVGDPDLSLYLALNGAPIAGTPGALNLCKSLPNSPQPGEVIFTELMISPSNYSETSRFTVEEWMELKNLTDKTFDFRGCAFQLQGYTDLGELDSDAIRAYPQDASPAQIGPDALQVWAAGGCLVSTTDGCAFGDGDNPLDGTWPADASFSSLTFSNSSPQRLSLVCYGPGGTSWEVDGFKFDFEANKIEQGHSWQLNPEFMTAEGNDDRKNWCQASYQQNFLQTDQGCNYGTPGSDNECLGQVPYTGDIGPGCRCDGGDGKFSFSQLGLGVLLLAQLGLLRRRRSRDEAVRH